MSESEKRDERGEGETVRRRETESRGERSRRDSEKRGRDIGRGR